MHDLRTREPDITDGQADSTLHRGGLAGILGSILMLVTFGFVAAFVGIDVRVDGCARSCPVRP